MTNIGFGDKHFNVAVYIGNQPKMSEYHKLSTIQPLLAGEIEHISQACGNGWRKVFNVYAKLLYSLDKQHFGFSNQALSWQAYRDSYLLQEKSRTALLFSSPQLGLDANIVHIICGKGHANALINDDKFHSDLLWLDAEFAIDIDNNLIVCPYFDYRQLSNDKIDKLATLLFSLKTRQ